MTGSVSFQRVILPGCALLIILSFVTLTRADPDLWGHVRFGGDIIDSAAIRLPDTYSFTSDKPWTNHEWLAEVIMASVYRMAGDAGLVLLKLTIIAVSLACVWRIVIGDGAALRPAAILTILALGGILPRAQQVRPQLFSVVLFSVLVLLLRRAEKRPAVLWLAPPLLAFWANLHGGWLVGCGTLGLWCAARSWTIRTEGPDYGRALVILWSACAASLAATLINPYGPGLWLFLAETVGLSRRFIRGVGPRHGRAHDVRRVGPLCAAGHRGAQARGPVALAAARHRRPVFWGIAAFKVSRLDTFFALSTVGFLAPDLIRAFNRERRRRSSPEVRHCAAQTIMAVFALVTLAVTVPLLKNNVLCIDVHASSSIPESDAMEFIRSRQLAERMVTFFDWGQYAIWHKPDDLRVSMDGRRETVYSERTRRPASGHVPGHGRRARLPRSLHADYVWIPTGLPLAGFLAKSPMWTPAYRSGRSIIFARSSLLLAGSPVQEGGAAQTRCFPGP